MAKLPDIEVGVSFVTPEEMRSLRRRLRDAKMDVEHWLRRYIGRSNEYGEFAGAATEAVEILEDMYEQRDAETDHYFHKWLTEAIQHGDTIAELNAAGSNQDALSKTKAALKDAEAKVAELYRMNDNQTRLIESMNDETDRLTDERDNYAASLKATRQLNMNQAATIRDLQGDREKLYAIQAALRVH